MSLVILSTLLGCGTGLSVNELVEDVSLTGRFLGVGTVKAEFFSVVIS